MTTKFLDLTGKKFKKWTVIERGKNDSSGKAKWLCKCDCGTIKLVQRASLRNGRSTGCNKCSIRGKKHLFSRTKTYKVWDAIIQRCCNKNNRYFKDYGGRGIFVCKEWREDFLNFINDMGEKPEGLTIDRINNDGPYCKENCRWASMKIQNRNRRNSLKIGEKINGFKLIERYDNPQKSLFQCVHCLNLILYDTSHIKTGRKKCFCQSDYTRSDHIP